MMSIRRAGMILVMTATALAGCSKDKQTAVIDPNAVPTNYRGTLVAFLRQSLTNRADFRGAMISEPVLKPVGDSQHYIVCVQLTPLPGNAPTRPISRSRSLMPRSLPRACHYRSLAESLPQMR